MRLIKFVLVLALLALALPAAAQEMTPEATETGMMDSLIIDLPGILPEGVEYDAAGERFLFGSLSQGTIYQLGADGMAEPFIEDGDLVSTVGIHIDTTNNRLLVTNSDSSVFSDPTATGQAMLMAYDLETGERLFAADMGMLLPESSHFANDVTVDADGNAYVTDSFSPVIYRVDPEGNAEILVESTQLMSTDFGLNGIDYHPDGYLLAAVSGMGSIYKIPLDDPEALTAVELSEPLGIDGMVLAEDGTLYAVATTFAESPAGVQELVAVTSDDDWTTATVTNRVETGGNATTVALRDGMPYYINAYLSNPEAEQYEIVPVMFEDME